MKFFLFLMFVAVALGQVSVGPRGFRNILAYSTYLGGNGGDVPHAVAVDPQGNVYIAGETVSSDFPVTRGAFQQQHGGVPGTTYSIFTGNPMPDAFITKLDPSGKIVYSTYLGGKSSDIATAIAVDLDGNVYVAGSTSSANFPTTTGAFQTDARSPFTHGFVAKLNPAGSALVYSTLLGGSSSEQVSAIRVDSKGNVYAVGTTSSLDFPVTGGAFQTTGAKAAQFTPSSGYVVKLDPAGSQLVYGTYLTGTAGSTPRAMALTAASEVLVAGDAQSSDFPTTAGAYQTRSTGHFVSRLNADGTALVYSLFFPGSSLTAIDVDSTGAAYLTGTTGPGGFPMTPGAVASQTSNGVFVAKLSPDGTNLVYGAVLGGDSRSSSSGVVVDSQGNAFVTGITYDSNFPLTSDAYQSGYNAARCLGFSGQPFTPSAEVLNCGDAFLTKLDLTASKVLYSTYFGSNGPDAGTALALGPDSSVYIVGVTQSPNLPATATALQTHRTQGSDCFSQASPSAVSSYPCDDGFLARFNLAVAAPALPFEIVNAASYLPGAIAPGELIIMIGPGIGPAESAAAQIDLSGHVPTTLAGIRVLFDNTPAPLLYVDLNQINVVVPYDVDTKSGKSPQVQVTIETNGVIGPAKHIQIAAVNPADPAVAPGIFSASGLGAAQAAVFNEDGTVNGPEHPAGAGSIASLYATGLGATTPASTDGLITDPALLPKTALPVITGKVEVFVGGQSAEVLYAGAAPHTVAGVTQVNFRVPQGSGSNSGTVPVYLSAGHTVSSQSGAWITVK